ncbi:MAG: hypothetical protein AAGJ31_07880 [Verrucomicrobiota bacterium]
MKKLILVINDHEEVGKTSFSAALVHFLRSHETDVTYLSIIGEEDHDSKVGEPSYDGTWNIIQDNKVDHLFDWCEKGDALVCDVQSGYADAVMEMYESEDLDIVLREEGLELTVVTPQVDEAICNEEIGQIADRMADHAYYVVPRIPVDEFGSYLESWEDSEASTALDYLGAVVLEVPRVTDFMQEVIEGNELSLVEALGLSSKELPEEVDSVMTGWRRDFDHQMEEAFDFLIPHVRQRMKIAS